MRRYPCAAITGTCRRPCVLVAPDLLCCRDCSAIHSLVCGALISKSIHRFASNGLAFIAISAGSLAFVHSSTALCLSARILRAWSVWDNIVGENHKPVRLKGSEPAALPDIAHFQLLSKRCQSWIEMRRMQPYRNATLAVPVSPRSARLVRVAREERGRVENAASALALTRCALLVHSAASSRASAFCRFAITAGSFM